MIVHLYHLKNSRSHRIVWLLEELTIKYQIIDSEMANTHEIPNDVLPLKFPTLHIIDTNTYLSETSAICEYLSNTHRALGADLNNLDYYFWKNYADSSFMQTLVLKQVFNQIVINTPWVARPITRFIKNSFEQMYLTNAMKEQLQRINLQLKTNKYICGDTFSYVDILLWFPIEASLVTIPIHDYPHIEQYLLRIKSRKAFVSAQLKGQWSQHQFNDYWT